jgi:Leucine-rich repeat (LRR) protein
MFDATNNPDLTCIEVDNALKANNGEAPYTSWKKPPGATYSENCIVQTTYVPDVNFELALQELGYDAGEPDHYVYTHDIATVDSLNVSGKEITDLTGIKDFKNLGFLNCSNNQIDTLDLSSNANLTTLDCSNNQLKSLNVRNGHNTLMTTFNATGNPALTCIEVDDEMKANGGLAPYADWQKDATAEYCSNCSLFGVQTYVPDDWFEGALISKGLDQGVLNDSVNASVISRVTSLDVSTKYIRDLTGIEGFTALEILNCASNFLENIDVKGLTALEILNCANNFLENIDVSQNSTMRELTCYHNQLTTLDLNHNSALSLLNCANNEIESLDVSHNPLLENLDCQINQISTLDLSNNPSLAVLSCRSNLLQNLDVSQNLALKTLDCRGNQITGLDFSMNTSLTHLDCGANQLQLTQLDVSGGALVELNCSYNSLTELVVSNNTNLQRLECQYNQLTNLDLDNNPKIWLLDCSHNQLPELDIGSVTALVDLVCRNNKLTSLVVGGNTLLGGLYCGNNQIESLILNNNDALLDLICDSNQITILDLSDNLRLRSILSNDNPLEDLIMPGESKRKGGEFSHSNKSEFEATATNTTLKSLNISKTALKSINVLNFAVLDALYVQGSMLDSLDVSGNVILRSLNTTDTPLKCIQVNQNQLNAIPAGWIKDATTTYSVNCKSSTSIDDEILAEVIIVYPNPACDILTIESGIPLISVEIWSVAGVKLMELHDDLNEIPIIGLPEGVYIIRIESEFGHLAKKFSKQ